MRMTSKKKLIIISLVSTLFVLAVVFLSLGLTIWRPKSTEEWLNDFSTAIQLWRKRSRLPFLMQS